jgi:hypothetical protein
MLRRTSLLICSSASAALLLAACEPPKKADADDADAVAAPESSVDAAPIDAQRSGSGLLEVKVDLRADGMLLNVGQIPPGATLECDLDEKPLVPCHDGALFARPEAGQHKVSVLALLGGATAAIGESEPFTILPGTGGAFDADDNPRNALTLVNGDKSFVNGGTVSLDKDFVAAFAFAKKPALGCKAEMRCKYDSRTSAFWTDCDGSYTIPKELLALGLQYLSVQASCGDDVGPILTYSFYGVPKDYAPMMLREIKDGNDRHIVNLVKADDCPLSQQKFECAETAEDDFATCANVVDAPAAGFRIRVTCEDRVGPELVLGPSPQ